jgi:hypothetical protein
LTKLHPLSPNQADSITDWRASSQGLAAVRNFDPANVTYGVIRVDVSLGCTFIYVRSTADSDRKFKALLPVVMCQNQPAISSVTQ